MKKIITCLIVVCFVITAIVSAYAVENPYDATKVNDKVATVAKNTWATVAIVVQFLAVGAVVFAGVRYMMASADQKADIKKGLMYLTIGAVLVFGATLIIQLVARSSKEVITYNSTPNSTPGGPNQNVNNREDMLN